VHWFTFESLPAGEYRVRAVVYRSQASTITAVDSFIVT
jgi:hypothetical protein